MTRKLQDTRYAFPCPKPTMETFGPLVPTFRSYKSSAAGWTACKVEYSAVIRLWKEDLTADDARIEIVKNILARVKTRRRLSRSDYMRDLGRAERAMLVVQQRRRYHQSIVDLHTEAAMIAFKNRTHCTTLAAYCYQRDRAMQRQKPDLVAIVSMEAIIHKLETQYKADISSFDTIKDEVRSTKEDYWSFERGIIPKIEDDFNS